jgi:hypothetical protein
MSPSRRVRLSVTLVTTCLLVLGAVLVGQGPGLRVRPVPPSSVPAAPQSFVALARAQLTDATTAAGGSSTVQLLGRAGVPATGVAAVLLDVGVSSSQPGYVSVYGAGQDATDAARVSVPSASSSSSVRIVVPLSGPGALTVANHSGSSATVRLDVLGYLRAQGAPAPGSSTSRYVRDLAGTAADAPRLHAQGCADARENGAQSGRLMLLDIGSQSNRAPLSAQHPGVQLSATSRFVTYPALVSALRGYVSGYSSCRVGSAAAVIAIGTNNDGYFDTYDATAKGRDWADLVIDRVRDAASGGVRIDGADDIEVSFTSTEAEAEQWERAYLSATSGTLVFNGSADHCPNSIVSTGGPCNDSYGAHWTQADYFALAHGLAPARLVALPQIYNADNAAQWAAIDLTGARGADHIAFVGALTENPLCGPGCNFTAGQGFDALRSALSVNPLTRPSELTVSTNLRVDA